MRVFVEGRGECKRLWQSVPSFSKAFPTPHPFLMATSRWGATTQTCTTFLGYTAVQPVLYHLPRLIPHFHACSVGECGMCFIVCFRKPSAPHVLPDLLPRVSQRGTSFCVVFRLSFGLGFIKPPVLCGHLPANTGPPVRASAKLPRLSASRIVSPCLSHAKLKQ